MYVEAAFYVSWIFSGLLSSLPHSVYSGEITRRPTTLLVTEIALLRLSMGEGMRGIYRWFIEETKNFEISRDHARAQIESKYVGSNSCTQFWILMQENSR